MELRVLQYFLAVAREQNISAAAHSLHLTQPTLSRQLRELEEELGKQLMIDLGIPVMCYGLRADFKGDLFPGSEALLVMADKIEEIKTVCWCGRKATFNARFDRSGKVLKEGEQVVLGANDQYIGLCRRHWMTGDLGPDFEVDRR